MANIAYEHDASKLNNATGLFAKLAKRFADYRMFQRSIAELSNLSDRELSDLGLHRGMIRATAHETVYGK